MSDASFVETGGPDPDVGAQRTNHRSPLFDLGTGDGESATGFERGFLGRLEFGQLCLEFVDPDRLAPESRGEFVEELSSVPVFGRDLTSIGIGALQGVGRRTQPLLDAGKPLGELIGLNRTLGKPAPSSRWCIGAVHRLLSALDLRFGFGERCTCGTRAGRLMRQPGTEPVASAGHDDLTGRAERGSERSLPVAVDGDRIGEQHVEQIIDRRVVFETAHELGAFQPECQFGCRGRGRRRLHRPEASSVSASRAVSVLLDDHGRKGVAAADLKGRFSQPASTATRSRSVPSDTSTAARR